MSLWLGILKAVLSIAGTIANYVERKQLLDAGQAQAIAKNLSETNKKLAVAIKARREVKNNVIDFKNDHNNRNNDKP